MQKWLGNYRRQAPVTLSIIVACLAVFVVTAVSARSLYGVEDTPLGWRMILWGPIDQPWRLVTSGFLHLDVGHVAINMILLLLIGREIERFTGPWLFAAVYLAGLLGSSAAVLWMNPLTPTAGASGAIYALLAVLVGVTARRGGDLRAPIVLVLANVVYSLLVPGISLWGHLGGLAAGLFLAWPATSSDPRVRWIGVGAVIVVAALLGLVLPVDV